MQLDDNVAVLSANKAFYAAFTAGDFNRMAEVWADGEAWVSCMHPNMAPLHGRDDVMASWKQILAGPGAAERTIGKIEAERVRCSVTGSTALVTCFESLDGADALVATNVFRKDAKSGRWRMVLHQAGQVMQPGVFN